MMVKRVKRRTITKEQRRVIKTCVKRGYSANKTQKQLQKRHIGVRREVLLKEIRKIRRVTAYRRKHVSRNYYPPIRAWRAPGISLGPRQITLTGKHLGKNVEKKRVGSGKELQKFVMEEIEGDYWDARPAITS